MIETWAEAELALRRLQPDFYFDVGPLFDDRWTGIPVVAAALAEELLRRFPGQVHFFFEDSLIVQAAIEDALRRRGGAFLRRDVERHGANAGPPQLLGTARRSIGLFPSVKSRRRLFDIECSVAHDLSTLVMPLFHVKDNIDHHMQRMVADLQSDDVTACVSDATRRDFIAYFGVPEEKLIVVYNGVAWPDWFAVQAANELDETQVEPYMLILGTREPRKNLACVLDLLASFPDVMETHRFVFAGRVGWLQEQQAIAEPLARPITDGRILFPGFVSDYVKFKLLMGAEATIYPSFFEGFGLPVLESLSVGTPCIASFSSSIPEVGGDLCWYHDPFSVRDLHRAVRDVQRVRPKGSAEFRVRCRDRAAQLSWPAMMDRIMVGIARAAAA